MINLLQETLEALNNIYKDESEVLWVGDIWDDRWMTWDEFKKVSDCEFLNEERGSDITH